MKITIIIIIWLFTLFPNLITKESYNWWVTRRKWGFRHQKSEAKYPKVSVANIGKLQEKFHSTVQNGCEMISQPCKILPLAWSDWLLMVVTPSFQLRIAHRLRHWICDFLRFEMVYRI